MHAFYAGVNLRAIFDELCRISPDPDRYRPHVKTPLTADPVEGKTTTIDFVLTSSEK